VDRSEATIKDLPDEVADELITENIPSMIYVPLAFCQWICENISSLILTDKDSVDDLQRIINIEMNSLISNISGYASIRLYLTDEQIDVEGPSELNRTCLKLCVANCVKMALHMLTEEIKTKFQINRDTDTKDQNISDLNIASQSDSAAASPVAVRKGKEKDLQIWNIEGQEETTRLLEWNYELWFETTASPMIKMFLRSLALMEQCGGEGLIDMNFNNRILKLWFDNINYYNDDEEFEEDREKQPQQKPVVQGKRNGRVKTKSNNDMRTRSKRKLSHIEGSSPATDDSADSDFHM